MDKEKVVLEQINTDADSSVRGIRVQKLRAAERLLVALKDNKKEILCTIEYIDDVAEIDMSGIFNALITEQDKSYGKKFTINSEEIIKSLRIFLDNWYFKIEMSNSIKFVFYTNTEYTKENRTDAIKAIEAEIQESLPDDALIELLINKDYDKAFPFVLPILKDYYLKQHSKHTDNIKPYKDMLESITIDKWKNFFDLIEWNFGKFDERDLSDSIRVKVQDLCLEYSVPIRYSNGIYSQLLEMIESRVFEKDFLEKMVHVSELKNLFYIYAQEVQVEAKLDPIHERWDEIDCDDVRNIEEKIKTVCNVFDQILLEDLQDDYTDGAFEQKHYIDEKEVKAYNYHIYKVCKRMIRDRNLKSGIEYNQSEIENLIVSLTNASETLILDKSKSYKMPYLDRDMIKKTILILLQDCYISFDRS